MLPLFRRWRELKRRSSEMLREQILIDLLPSVGIVITSPEGKQQPTQ